MGDLTLSRIMYDYRFPFATTRSERHSYALEVRPPHVGRAFTIRKLIKSSSTKTNSLWYILLSRLSRGTLHTLSNARLASLRIVFPRVNMGQYTEVAATVLELDEVRLGA